MNADISRPVPAIVTIVGKSNSGKTTLLEKLVRELSGRGVRVGTVKHAHRHMDFDRKGKDTWRHRNAGAAATLALCPDQAALIRDNDGDPRALIQTHLSDMDLILVEGLKHLPLPKIEIFRRDGPHPTPLFEDPGMEKHLVALVSDSDFEPRVPVFGLEQTAGLADFIQARFLEEKP